MKYQIRKINQKDNLRVEEIIRSCLIEFGANHEGTAWTDPNLGRFSEVYSHYNNCYFVAENELGEIVGGVGIGELDKSKGLCELQKMYCIKEVRGCGVAHLLMDSALKFARQYYQLCYIETLDNMKAAQKFYEKYGFIRIEKPLIETTHFLCDIRYVKHL